MINLSRKNAQVAIQGKSIIIDYEFNLHRYTNERELKEHNLVPVEMYPYYDDILVGYIKVEPNFDAIDLEELYKWALEAIESESALEDAWEWYAPTSTESSVLIQWTGDLLQRGVFATASKPKTSASTSLLVYMAMENIDI